MKRNFFLNWGRVLVGLVAVFFLITVLSAEAYYFPGKAKGFVNDFAGVLKPEEKKLLEDRLNLFEQQSSNEISVVIIPGLSGDTIENFALKLFEDYKIGKKDQNNGLLLLIALEERKVRIEVGYGLEGALTDAQSWWIIKNKIQPEFRTGNYFGGINGAIEIIINATKGEYVPALSNDGESGISADDDGGDLSTLLFVFIIIGIQGLGAILGRSKAWWPGGVMGVIAGIVVGIILSSILFAIVSAVVLGLMGLVFDFIVSNTWKGGGGSGGIPGSRRTFFPRFGSGGGGFGGFGGGRSGGGGASGGW